MARRDYDQKEPNEATQGYAGQALRPMNDFERLQEENQKLRAEIESQKTELLNLYRRINGGF